MFGMLKFQVPEVEVIYFSQVFVTSIQVLYLWCGHRSLWLAPMGWIRYELLCYE